MADIVNDTGIGLDIRQLSSGTDVIGVFPSGTFNTNISSFPLFDLGSPGFQQSTVLTSGTYTNIWTAGTGSKVELHGWEISSHVPQMVRLIISGTSYTTLNRFRMPASGTVIRTLVHPITPGLADEDIGVGTTVAGSVDITIYGRDKV